MYRIGELAKLAGLSVETLRFYERQGLMLPPQRQENAYRVYAPSDLQRLQFIQRAKQAGLANKDIVELLSLREHADEVSCGDVRGLVDKQLSKVREQLLVLQQFEATLSELHDACCGGDESAVNCAILKALDDVLE